MSVEPKDTDLIARAVKGDRPAFGALVKKYQRRVYATAFHLTGNHGDADDVSQDAFVRAYRGLAGFDGRADFFTWLYRIVVNTALNHLRSRKRAHTVPQAERDADDADVTSSAPAVTTDPRVAAEAREQLAQVLTALAELSPSLRITLLLATVEELSYHDIAQALAIPEGTVAWRVNQARKQLRQRLQASLGQDTQERSIDEVLRRTKESLGAG